MKTKHFLPLLTLLLTMLVVPAMSAADLTAVFYAQGTSVTLPSTQNKKALQNKSGSASTANNIDAQSLNGSSFTETNTGISVSFSKGTNTSSYPVVYNSNGKINLRLYSGNTMTVTAPEGYVVKSVKSGNNSDPLSATYDTRTVEVNFTSSYKVDYFTVEVETGGSSGGGATAPAAPVFTDDSNNEVNPNLGITVSGTDKLYVTSGAGTTLTVTSAPTDACEIVTYGTGAMISDFTKSCTLTATATKDGLSTSSTLNVTLMGGTTDPEPDPNPSTAGGTDVLTIASLGLSSISASSYNDTFSASKATDSENITSTAVYGGRITRTSDNLIQIQSTNSGTIRSGVYTTSSTGQYVKSVIINVASGKNASVGVYVSNSPIGYTSSNFDLSGATKIGENVTSTSTVNINGNYKYVAVVGTTKNASYLSSIVINWESAEEPLVVPTVTFNPADGSTVYDESTLTITINPSDYPMEIASSNENDLIDDAEGLVMFGGVGERTITVTYYDSEAEEHTATATYTVIAKPEPQAGCTVTFNAGSGSCGTSSLTQEAGDDKYVTLPAATIDLNHWTFFGWATASISETRTEPTLVGKAGDQYHADGDCTLYAVYHYNVEEKVTMQYDTWTYSGTTTDKSSYRLFGNGAYVETNEAIDLSLLDKVVVYGGTFGGSSNNGISIKSAAGDVWKNGTVSGNSQTGTNTFTGGASLTGTDKLRVYSTSGNGTSDGVRISKVEITLKDSKYNSNPFNKATTSITWSAETFSYVVGTNNESELPTWTITPSELAEFVTVTSDKESVATVDDNNVVSIVGDGQATIKAKFAGNEQYEASEATYVLTVTDPSQTMVLTRVDSDMKFRYGDKLLFVGKNNTGATRYGMTKYLGGTNIPTASVDNYLSNDDKTLTISKNNSEEFEILEVQYVDGKCVLYATVKGGYLYPPTNRDKNYLKVKDTYGSDCTGKFAFNNDGQFTFTFDEVENKVIMFNNTSGTDVFSCYAGTQNAFWIYRLEDGAYNLMLNEGVQIHYTTAAGEVEDENGYMNDNTETTGQEFNAQTTKSHYVNIDLGSHYDIDEIVIAWDGEQKAKNYEIYVMNGIDGIGKTHAHDVVYLNDAYGSKHSVLRAEPGVLARHLLIKTTETEASMMKINQIYVYGRDNNDLLFHGLPMQIKFENGKVHVQVKLKAENGENVDHYDVWFVEKPAPENQNASSIGRLNAPKGTENEIGRTQLSATTDASDWIELDWENNPSETPDYKYLTMRALAYDAKGNPIEGYLSDGSVEGSLGESIYEVNVASAAGTVTGVENVGAGAVADDAVYYNLQGMRISRPGAGQIVIRRQGANASTVLVK